MAKSKYESHVLPNLDKIIAWAQSGATVKDIAAKLKIAYSTFRKYVDDGEKGDERYAALSAAFAQACAVSDDEIETALFNRARGISYDERIYELVRDEESGEYVERCTKRVRKYIPPDPTSAMFWLTNRRLDKWRYKPEPSDDDEKGTTGVVQLPPVMPTPEPPKEVSVDG